MAVRKFRDPGDPARRLWLVPGDPRIWEGVVRRWRLHRFFSPVPPPTRAPGVFKFRSLADKQRQQS